METRLTEDRHKPRPGSYSIVHFQHQTDFYQFLFSRPYSGTAPLKAYKVIKFSQVFGNRNIAPEEDEGPLATSAHLHIRQEMGCAIAKHEHVHTRNVECPKAFHQYLRKKPSKPQLLPTIFIGVIQKESPKVKKYIMYKTTFPQEEGSARLLTCSAFNCSCRLHCPLCCCLVVSLILSLSLHVF